MPRKTDSYDMLAPVGPTNPEILFAARQRVLRQVSAGRMEPDYAWQFLAMCGLLSDEELARQPDPHSDGSEGAAGHSEPKTVALCGNGLHPWTEENTRRRLESDRRTCKACERIRNAARREERKAG